MTGPAAQAPLFAGPGVLALGIDPGSVVTGWGLVRKQGRTLEHVDSGTLRPSGRLDYRLEFMRSRVLQLLDKHEPDVVGIETQFTPQPKARMTQEEAARVAGQQQAALKLSQARGAITCAIGKVEHALGRQQPVVTVNPASVKKAVGLNGRAKKDEVQRGVRAILGLGLRPMQPDESDALAIAICACLEWRR